MLDLLSGRELGVSPRIFQNVQRYSATLSLGSEYIKKIHPVFISFFSLRTKLISNAEYGDFTWMDIDPAENKL